MKEKEDSIFSTCFQHQNMECRHKQNLFIHPFDPMLLILIGAKYLQGFQKVIYPVLPQDINN